MTRGAKIVVFSVVGLFVLAGIYYGFVAPTPTPTIDSDSNPTVFETQSLTLDPSSNSLVGALPNAAVPAPATPAGASAFPSTTDPAFARSTSGVDSTVPVGTVAVSPNAGTGALPVVPGLATPMTKSSTTFPTTTLPLVTTEPQFVHGTPAPSTAKSVAVTPARTTTTSTASSYAIHTVVAGDTLTGIAGEWFKDTTRWGEIVAVNPGLNPSNLKIGQKLNLPAKTTSVSAKSTKAASTTVAQATAPKANEHVVVSGETLASIADKSYGNRSNWKRIYEANKAIIGSNPSALKVGMRLTIPASKS